MCKGAPILLFCRIVNICVRRDWDQDADARRGGGSGGSSDLSGTLVSVAGPYAMEVNEMGRNAADWEINFNVSGETTPGSVSLPHGAVLTACV